MFIGSSVKDHLRLVCAKNMLQKAAMQPHPPEGYGTVGTLVHVTHEHATAMGRRVSCTSKLVEIDRRRLVFEVEAQDEAGIIGRGRHERFIIENTKFLARANGR